MIDASRRPSSFRFVVTVKQRTSLNPQTPGSTRRIQTVHKVLWRIISGRSSTAAYWKFPTQHEMAAFGRSLPIAIVADRPIAVVQAYAFQQAER
jgi:hypothetical protein